MQKKKTAINQHRSLRWIVASISAFGLAYVAAADDTSTVPETPTLTVIAVPTAPVVAPEESQPLPTTLPAKDIKAQADVAEDNEASQPAEKTKEEPLPKTLEKTLLVPPTQQLAELFETESAIQLDDEPSSETQIAQDTATESEEPDKAADTVESNSDDDEPTTVPEVTVKGHRPAFDPVLGSGTIFGNLDGAFDASGSGAFLELGPLKSKGYDNPNRILNNVPGVYLREEDGFGNFPNISLRGADMGRSAKITLMEDGILVAPAPYSAPSAYFFPTVGRMSAVEVFKGSSQIQFGPHSTGGAINFLSTPIPDRKTIYMNFLFGTNNEMRMHTWLGNTMKTADGGRVGWLIEGYFRETDGFRKIGGANYPIQNAQDTGFTKQEPMFKMFWEPGGVDTYQRFEVKTGYTSFQANEGYVGQTMADFNADPYARYSGTRFDNMQTHGARNYLRWIIGDQEVDWMTIAQTVYYNNFHRDWYKLNKIYDGDLASMGTSYGISNVLGDPIGNVAGYGVLNGTQAGVLGVKHNNRDYYSWGYQGVMNLAMQGAKWDHDIQLGLRFNADRVRRFQRQDFYETNSVGGVSGFNAGTSGAAGDRRQTTNATAFWAMDRMSRGKWTLTPGIRVEKMNMRYQRFANENTPQDNTGSLTMTSGGLGLTYKKTENLSFLASVNRGVSPPDPKKLTSGLSEEEVIASEFGWRYTNPDRAVVGQLLYFYSHFNDLIVLDNVGSGADPESTDQVGSLYANGLEFTLQYDRGIDKNLDFNNPLFVSATYTDAALLTDTLSHDAESIFAGGQAGALVPYIPEFTVTFGAGWHFDKSGFDITGTYSDATFTTASNETFVDGVSTDARYGKTNAYFIWDMSAYYMFNENWKIFGGAQNIFNESYVVTRHPYGPRTGAPAFVYVGVEALY
jgi:Fe(3+) dicitrate transport protein